ncbi:molybdopterin-guanine dinucleotide biosynthesis protein MobC [Roseobacter cerasinus]|uniref:Molybdopterin-guanine dinucleotide biosynthesis protein MobC n=1 Tax=Roseobacter cerasinus TaxID=2602289 RepID=A0A640VRH7_9RHOB|nr:GNAT family N-acetyltransferase [Roseobacter cerasinus]GFE48806.1 molybdopterin-guanine dinucleotide biosynthesis protein MobC [Roseobacter cerasinus]
MQVTISTGFQDHERRRVASLYWQAFGRKLGRSLGPDERALRFLESVLDPEFALIARSDTGDILGIAGFKTEDGTLVGGDLPDLQRIYGWWGGLWRGLLLSVIERDVTPDVLLMDGICVSEQARGFGIGSALLDVMKDEATARGKQAVRLDVIDSNPRAKALYERQGFVATSVEHTGIFETVFRFRSATRMLWHARAK